MNYLKDFNYYFFNYSKLIKLKLNYFDGDWGLGIGDWGLGIG